VRDVLAWMRLLVDPQDAAAVVRALARPPIELRQTHLARVIQLARRRRLDLVAGLALAVESPQVPPEARERIERFLELHGAASAGAGAQPADALTGRLIELLAARTGSLLTAQEAAAQRDEFERVRLLAASFLRSSPQATLADLTRHLAWLGRAEDVQRSSSEDEPAGDQLHEAFCRLREEVLESVGRIGGRLGELRLDTELDIAHGVARYLELVKLAALLQRSPPFSMHEALADINARLLAATTPVQREILQTSLLDEHLLAEGAEPGAGDAPPGRGDGAGGRRSGAPEGPRGLDASYRGYAEEHSLGPFLPRKGVGLALSASDIETYRSCPLRYKFARVLRIPTEQTLHQRFGIVIHQVLERFHAEGSQTLAEMLELFDAVWRRAGLGDGEEELRKKGRAALTRYHARLAEPGARPVWFERTFDFRLGPHHLRGRVDRVDCATRSDGGQEYELIDYKTSRPKTAAQLEDDVQLSLYALAAREAWSLESSRQAYYYVLDDRKVPVPAAAGDGAAAITQTVLEVGDGILAQRFAPTPSPATCAICDYRIVCPAAET
jgi:RecB family exonuclease